MGGIPAGTAGFLFLLDPRRILLGPSRSEAVVASLNRPWRSWRSCLLFKAVSLGGGGAAAAFRARGLGDLCTGVRCGPQRSAGQTPFTEAPPLFSSAYAPPRAS